MKEIEVKILDIDVEKITSLLESLGAKKVFEGEVVSIFFDSKLENTLLRLRKKGDKALITVKKKIESEGFKAADEFECNVSDFDEMKRVLLGLGFVEVAKDYKKRISYVLEEGNLEIDTFEGIPSFLEIEAETKEKVEKIVKLLGYEMKDTCTFSGKEVKECYN